jgi:hypothetical protein
MNLAELSKLKTSIPHLKTVELRASLNRLRPHLASAPISLEHYEALESASKSILDELWKRLLDEMRQKWSPKGVDIQVVDPEEIQRESRSRRGCFSPNVGAAGKLRAKALISNSIGPIQSVQVLFHELGHASDAFDRESEVVQLIEKDMLECDPVVEEAEFRASQICLKELLVLVRDAPEWEYSLVGEICRLNQPTMPGAYEKARERLLKTAIWRECQNWLKRERN